MSKKSPNVQLLLDALMYEEEADARTFLAKQPVGFCLPSQVADEVLEFAVQHNRQEWLDLVLPFAPQSSCNAALEEAIELHRFDFLARLASRCDPLVVDQKYVECLENNTISAGIALAPFTTQAPPPKLISLVFYEGVGFQSLRMMEMLTQNPHVSMGELHQLRDNATAVAHSTVWLQELTDFFHQVSAARSKTQLEEEVSSQSPSLSAKPRKM